MNILDLMYQIQESSPPQIIYLPKNETQERYSIDLTTRTIKSPQFLSVLKDHRSETVYFEMDRYYDYMDLATTTCIIYYITPDQQSHIYVVPFYDIEAANEVMYDKDNNSYIHRKIVFPWLIDGAATQFSGTIEYCIQFFKIDSETKEVLYQLTTQSTKSQILHGLDPSSQEYGDISMDDDLSAEMDKLVKKGATLRSILEAVSNLYDSAGGPYWLVLD